MLCSSAHDKNIIEISRSRKVNTHMRQMPHLLIKALQLITIMKISVCIEDVLSTSFAPY